MSATVIGVAIIALLVGTIGAFNSRHQKQLKAARKANDSARRASNLKQTLSVMPRGYLPEPGFRRIIADIMILSRQGPFPKQGKALQVEIEKWREQLDASKTAGPEADTITTKEQVEIIKVAARDLHEYVACRTQEDHTYCEEPEAFLTALKFSYHRAVSDFYNNLAGSYIKSNNEYKACLVLKRAVAILEPWREKVVWADHACEDYQKRARELAPAGPKVTGNEKKWDEWMEAENWKKKAVYD